MKNFESDIELVSACLKHNPEAQRALYDKYINAMYNTVYRYTCNHHDTQDILQNGFTRVFKNLAKFDKEKGDLLYWIRKIHIHCSLDFLKKKQLAFEDISEITSHADNCPSAIENMEAEYLLTFIQDLNPRDRIIFNMFHIEGYSHEEIASMLSINVNSSRVYLARAKNILKKKITACSGQPSLAP